MPEVQLRIPVRCPAGPVRSHGFLVPQAAARDPTRWRDCRVERRTGRRIPPRHPQSGQLPWPPPVGPLRQPLCLVVGFFCLFQFSPGLVFFPLSEGWRERTRVGAGEGQAGIPWCDTAIKRTCFADSRGPCSSLPGEEGDEGVRSSAGARVPLRSRARPPRAVPPSSCRVGRGHRARGLGRRAWRALGTPAAALPRRD